MTRKKVTLAYITKYAERKSSYKKRKKGLLKKVYEITELCGVEACAIIYGENEKEPTVWPSREGALQVLEKFRRLSGPDKTKKMVDQERFSQQRIDKAHVQLQRLRRENKRKEMELFMYRVIAGQASFQEFDMSNVAEMKSVVQEILRDVRARIEAQQGSVGQINNANTTNEVAHGPGPGYGNI